MALNKSLIWILVMVILSFNAFAVTQISYYDFDGDADDQWSGYDGTVSGATQDSNVPTFNVSGDGGTNSYLFDGSNDEITMSPSETTDVMSVSMWVQLQDTDKQQVFKWRGTSNYGFSISYQDNDADKFRAFIYDGATLEQVISTDTFPSTTGWYHIVITYDQTNLKMYINNSLQDTEPSTINIDNINAGQFGNGDAGYFNGYMDEVKVFDGALTTTEIQNLYNCNDRTGCAAPVPSNATTEMTGFFPQISDVVVTTTSYADIFSGTIEIINTTQAYLNYAVNVLPNNADSTCRVVVDDVDYDTERTRTGTTGNYGVMYLTSSNFTLTKGNYTTELQCKKVSSGFFTVTNSVGIMHVLQNAQNESINASYYNTVTRSFGSAENSSRQEYTVANNNLSGSKVLSLIVEGDWTFNYPAVDTDMFANISIDSADCGYYQRRGTSSSTGSGAFFCLLENASFNRTNITTSLLGANVGAEYTLNSSFFVKEFVMNKGSVNHTSFGTVQIDNVNFVDIASVTINNSEFSNANLVAKASASVQSDSGAGEIDLRLKIASKNGSVLHRDVSAANEYGIASIQYIFEGLGESVQTVTLQGRCDNAACSTGGGDLIAYLTDEESVTINSLNLSIRDDWSNNSLSNFTVITSDGTNFTTTGSSVQVFSANPIENITVVKPQWFNLTIYNQSMNVSTTADLFQTEITFNVTELITGNNLDPANFTVDGRTTANNVFRLNASASSYVVIASKNTYYDKNKTFNVSPLQNSSVTVENLYNAIINVTLTEYVSGDPVANFNITTDYGLFVESQGGYADLPILQNISPRKVNITNSAGTGFVSIIDYNVSANQTLQDLNIFVFTFNSILINIYDAATLSLIDDRNVTIVTISNTTSFSNDTDTGQQYIDFLAPKDYELRFNATNYNPRSVFLTVLNDSTQNISVYMTSNASTELQIVEVVDTGNQEVEGAVVWLQQEIINSSSQWVTVQEAITDFSGQTSVWVVRDTTVFYRFAVIVDGIPRPILPNRNTVTGKTSFIPAVTETIQLIIDNENISQRDITDKQSINGTIYYNQTPDGSPTANNNTAFYEWIDGRNTISGGLLEIWGRYLVNSSTYVLISNTSLAGSSGVLNYTFTPINNTYYIIKGYVTFGDRKELIVESTKSFDINVMVDKNTGLLYAVFVLVVVSLITLPFSRQLGKRGLAIAGSITFGTLIFLTIFGIISIPYALTTTIIAFIIILFAGVKTTNE